MSHSAASLDADSQTTDKMFLQWFGTFKIVGQPQSSSFSPEKDNMLCIKVKRDCIRRYDANP